MARLCCPDQQLWEPSSKSAPGGKREWEGEGVRKRERGTEGGQWQKGRDSGKNGGRDGGQREGAWK